VGLLSYGSNYNLDFAPVAQIFQNRHAEYFGLQSNNIYFDTNNSTNTGEGLVQALVPTSPHSSLRPAPPLNVTFLITDAGPAPVTGFVRNASPTLCSAWNTSNKTGYHLLR